MNSRTKNSSNFWKKTLKMKKHDYTKKYIVRNPNMDN